MVLKQVVGGLIAGCLALPLLCAAASTPGAYSRETAAQVASRWDLVVYDRFDSGGVPRHWARYDGPYGSGPQNCARPDHAFVKDGSLRMVLRYRLSGDCGAGWYSAGMKLARRFESVDQKISVRFRVKSVDGVRAHRIIPMRWPSSGHGPEVGEEDYCEGTPLRGCTAYLHHSGGQEYHQLHVNLATWHTMTFVRRNFTVRVLIDGVRRWTYRGTEATLPATLKRPVLQQECSSNGCPEGRSGREVILIDWIKVWNPSTGS